MTATAIAPIGIRRGDKQGLKLTVTFPAGYTASTDLTAYDVWMQARPDPSSAPVFDKHKPAGVSAQSGITVDSTSLNVAHILLTGSDTSDLACPPPTFRTTLVYDVQVQLPGDDPVTVCSGQLVVSADVTH